MKLRTLLPLLGLGLLTACSNETGSSNADSTAAAPATEVISPVAPTEEAEPRQVLSESLPYGEVGAELVYGHFAFPADMVEPLPAVVMIHERWGLTDTVREQADQLAREGYIVLAVDLVGGRTTDDGVASNRMMQEVLESPDETLENIRQALDFVSSAAGAPSAAVLGFDLGGEWALKAAIQLPEMIDAAVTVYGSVTSDPDQLTALQAPVLGLFGGKDRIVPISNVQPFEESLAGLGKEYLVHVYPEADHYFMNTSRERSYRPGAAKDAWGRINTVLAGQLADSAQ